MQRQTTTGYQTSEGAYYLVIQDREEMSIKQILFNCGIYPAPIKEVEKKDWLNVLESIQKNQNS